MIPGKSLGIAAEHDRKRISVFDTDRLEVIERLEVGADVVGVAIGGGARAFACALRDKRMFQIDLNSTPARVVGSAAAETFLEDVAATPDGRFALAVDGLADQQALVSYSAKRNEFVSALPSGAQAVAISPKNPALVLATDYRANSVRRFALNPDGSLEDTGQTFPAGLEPNDLAFSPSGEFVFIAARAGDRISVLSARDPANIASVSGAQCMPGPQSVAVSRDGRHVFALTAYTVDVFAFDPVAASLRRVRSFEHGLSIPTYFGVDQIALDARGERVFVSGVGRVAAFTAFGQRLGDVSGAEGSGGIAICR